MCKNKNYKIFKDWEILGLDKKSYITKDTSYRVSPVRKEGGTRTER